MAGLGCPPGAALPAAVSRAPGPEGRRAFGRTLPQGSGPVGSFDGYRPLLVQIIKCFRTGKVPVGPEETLELYAFMEAADESKRQGGASVTIESVLAKARKEAAAKLQKLMGQ